MMARKLLAGCVIMVVALALAYLAMDRGGDTRTSRGGTPPSATRVALHVAQRDANGDVTVTADTSRVWPGRNTFDRQHFLFFQIDGGTLDKLPYSDDRAAGRRLGYGSGQVQLTGNPGTLEAGRYSANLEGRIRYSKLPPGRHTVKVWALDGDMKTLGTGRATFTAADVRIVAP